MKYYTYTHFGSGEPQSAQTLLPDWDKRPSSFPCGPDKGNISIGKS